MFKKTTHKASVGGVFLWYNTRMPTYIYHATDAAGNSVTGTVEAATFELAEAAVKDKGLVSPTLTEQKPPSFFEAPLRGWSRVRELDKVVFARQLSVLVGAQVPLVAALRTVANQTSSEAMRLVVVDLANEVEGGLSFSVAMGNHPKVFPEFASALVQSGETTGRLEEVLNYLADQQEKDHDLRKKIQGAMFYPAFILSGLVVVGIVMMVFVIPKLTGILTESGAKLPLATRVLISVSNFFASYIIGLLILVVVALLGARFALKLPEVRRRFDWMRLYLPVVGQIWRRLSLIRFCRSMRTLVLGGVPVPEALRTSAHAMGNAYLSGVVTRAAREVEDGASVSVTLSETKLIPKMVPQMMAVGEETGKLGEILGRLSDFYTREVDAEVAGLVTVIEPIIIVVIGVAVGFMVSAIILPMYNLANQF